jgi:hypothetical protein
MFILLADIDAIGPTEAWLEGIPPGKIAHFAGEARVSDIADLRKVLNEDKRLTLIASLVHVVRAGVRDDVVAMFGLIAPGAQPVQGLLPRAVQGPAAMPVIDRLPVPEALGQVPPRAPGRDERRPGHGGVNEDVGRVLAPQVLGMGLDMITAVLTGLVDQQISNGPGGERWVGLADEAADMLLAHLTPKRRPASS